MPVSSHIADGPGHDVAGPRLFAGPGFRTPLRFPPSTPERTFQPRPHLRH